MRTRIAIYVILVCLIYFPLAGQDFRQESAVESVESVDQPARNLWWVTYGISHPYAEIFCHYLGLSFSPARVPWLLTTVRWSWVETDYFLGGEGVMDISALIGAIAKHPYAYVSASSGIGDTCIYGYGNIDHEYEDLHTVGLTFELQAFVTPTSWFGLGLVSVANVNSKKSVVGYAICVQLGRLRR
jgi:hypothetical protein